MPVRTQQGEVSPAPPPAMDSHKGVNLTTATADAPRAEALVQKQELVESTLSEMPRAEALYRAAAPGTSPEKESDDMSPADKLRAAAKKAGETCRQECLYHKIILIPVEMLRNC